MQYPNLFLPIRIGKLEVKNRIALSPMGTGTYNDDETVAEKYIDFIKARTKETGLIIVTGCRVSSKYGKLKFFGCYSDNQIPGLSKLAGVAHNNGTKIFLQILALGGMDPEEPYVPSLSVPDFQGNWAREIKPKELKKYQIEEVIKDFTQGAVRAKEAGFDGVELFGSEEGLISEFITPYFNRRMDEYGGNFENIMRFPTEIIKGIKKACGIDFPVGFKFNAFYDIENGISLDYGVTIAKKIVEAGADYIHEWSFASLNKPMSLFKYSPLPNLYQPRNSTIPISQNLKSHLNSTPVIAVCGILKPDEADKIIGDNKADMVAIGRGYIAENEWGFKSKYNQRIRPCIRCHVCHHEVAILGKEIVCSINPDVFGQDEIIKVTKSMMKNIIVIGGGPAGIISAITASKRGHFVTLYEKEGILGGKLIQGSIPDFKYEFKDLLNYLREEINDSGAKINLNTEVTPDLLKKEQPDCLIIAIGADPIIPEVFKINNSKIITAVQALSNLEKYKNLKVAVIGGGDVGCETALCLKLKGNEVTIIEQLDELMKSDDIKHNTCVLEKMLKEQSTNIFLNSEVIGLLGNTITIKNLSNNNVSTINANLIVLATGYKEPTEKVKKFQNLCRNSFVLGDCLKYGGRLRNAIGEGYNIVKQL